MHLPPVHLAILAFGGKRPLAAAIGRPHQRVIEWSKPYSLGGNDGEFPNPVIIRQVLDAAKERAIADLTLFALVYGRDMPTDQVMAMLPPQTRLEQWGLALEDSSDSGRAPVPVPAPPRGR